ncbi:MAG: branched-chain amino acid transport system ATP-binding protein [Frankiaceae bacterium]|jgi:branched-chain amino acid transport system ATP-binding protein|nr:branched-chain amino acid transport system ATP-binding protein [Frankiaceae bacterium]
MSVFEVRDLSVRTRGAALRGVDLYVTAGEVVGLLGDGGGSALLRTAAGLIAPASGVVRIEGEDVTGRGWPVVRRLGVVLLPTERAPYGDLTVRENVTAGAAAAPGCGRGGAAARVARCEAVLGWFPSLAAVSGVHGAALGPELAATLVVAVGLARARRLLLVDGLAPYVGRAAYAEIVAALRAAASADGTSTVLADVVPEAAPVVDPADFDRAFLVRDGELRPWYAAVRAADG